MSENYLNQLMQGTFETQKEPLVIPQFNPMAPYGNQEQNYGGMTGEHLGTMETPTPSLLSRLKSAGGNMMERIDQTPGGNDALIQFGAGMLSGNGFADGLSKGFAGANAGFAHGEEMQAKAEKQEADEAYRYNALLAKANGSEHRATWNKSGQQVRWIDENGEEQLRGARLKDGEPYIQDEEGVWKPVHEIADTTQWRYVNKSDQMDVEQRVAGIPNAIYYDEETKTPVFQFQREGEQKAYGYALRSIAAQRELDALMGQADPETVTNLTESLKRWAAGNANEKVTGAVLNEAIGEALPQEMQGAAYRFLQGILRVDTGAAYTGTEIANYASAFLPSPGDTAESMQAKRMARGLESLGIASRTGAAAPYLLQVMSGKREIPSMYAAQAHGYKRPKSPPKSQPSPTSTQDLIDNPPW